MTTNNAGNIDGVTPTKAYAQRTTLTCPGWSPVWNGPEDATDD